VQAKKIYLFTDDSEQNTLDLAVIVLEKKISFSNGVKPVCIDWYSKYNLQNGSYGKVNLFY